MLKYFRPLKYDDYTLSIDKIVCDYHFHPKQRELLMKLLDEIGYRYCCNLKYHEEYKIGTFRMRFNIDIGDGNSFWVGCGLNQSKVDYGKVRIEYNPNKVALYSSFQCVLAFLNCSCSPMHTTIKRFDLAIDYPCMRENAFLIKDNRVYSEVSYSETNKTQYLGKKNTTNYVKLYNKQLESELSHPLTRLELTLDPKQAYEDINFPTVYFVRDMQVAFDELKVNETERFILNSLLHNVGDISTLGRYMRVKMEKLLNFELGYVSKNKIDKVHYLAILSQLRSFINFPTAEFEFNQYVEKEYIKQYLTTSDLVEVDLSEIGNIFEGGEDAN